MDTTVSRIPDFEKRAFYTPEEVAEILRVHVSTVREWIRSGRLFAFHLSARVNRIPLVSVMEILGETHPVRHRTISTDETDAVWAAIEREHARE